MKSLSFLLTSVLAFNLWAQAAQQTTPQAVSQDTSAAFLSQLEPLQDDSFISTPDQDHQPLIDAFNQAKTSIYVGIFGISDTKIADALSAAQKRGVNVMVICDKYCTNSPKRAELYNKLKADGVDIYTATTGFSISHWKMFIVDEKIGFISTMNFIIKTEQMRDMGVFFSNPNIIQEMVKVFKSDVENAKNQTANTPPLSNPNLVWSPNNSETKLVQLIKSANKTIDIWIENVGNQNVHQALKDATARGVKVRVLTSECGMGVPPATAFVNLKDLASGGINVHVMPYPATSDVPYIHAKTINVDHNTVFLGSENYSYNSLLKSRELGIIFQDSAIQSRMNDLYEKDWAGSITLPETAPDKCNPLSVAI